MKTIHYLGISAIAVAFLLLGCDGCGGVKGIGDDYTKSRQKALACTFTSEKCPYLFTPGPRGGIRAILGSSLPEDFMGLEHTSDGTVLRLPNYERTQYYVLAMGQEPRIIDTPPGAFLNSDNQVALRCEDRGRGDVVFSDGLQMRLPEFELDDDGQYLCVGGTYYDYSTETRGSMPITIRSMHAPEKVLATSSMTGILSKPFCFPDRLYVFARQYPEGNGTGWMACEVYRRQGSELVFTESMKIESPLWLSSWVLVKDVCPDQEHILLYAKRDLPLPSHRYLFDMKTRKTWDLGSASTESFVGFLDRHVFDELLEQPASGPSQPE